MACFDKTGTLTAGKPQVTDVIGLARSENDVLGFAAALEAGSSHPLATAILAEAHKRDIPIPATSGSEAVGGKGISRKGRRTPRLSWIAVGRSRNRFSETRR